MKLYNQKITVLATQMADLSRLLTPWILRKLVIQVYKIKFVSRLIDSVVTGLRTCDVLC